MIEKRNAFKLESDIELELAKLLVESESHGGVNSADHSLDKFSLEQLHELRRAQESLNLLNKSKLRSVVAQDTMDLQQDVRTNGDINEIPIRSFDYSELPNSIGRFRIIEKIGSGGFGIVLKARDESLNRDVALKIPRVETIVSQESRKRFEREARAAGSLSHPAIIPIYEFGFMGPVPYIAFEFCEGISLDQWIKKSDFVTPEIAARLVARLADALGHAHRRGVIHRDIKPGNILLSSGDRCDEAELLGSVRITDFGLATLNSDEENLTVDGAFIGTPSYMSPEQAHGENEGGPAIDIYSLGVVLFQLLTGDVPFKGKSNLAILKSITEEPAPSPREFNSKVPDDLAAICLKCLEKNPTDRYDSASDLSDDLYRFFNQRPIRAKRPSAMRQYQLWLKRNPVISLLSFLLFAALAIGFATTWQQYRKSQANLKFAESNFQQAKDTVDKLLTRALSVELETQPVVRKEMLQTVSRFYQQFIEQNQNDPDLDYDLAISYRNLAKIDAESGKYRDALERLQSANELFKQTVNRQSAVDKQLESFANQIDIGLQYDRLGRLEDSIVAYDTAIKFGRQLKLQFPENVEIQLGFARVLKNKGAVLRQQDDLSGSKPFFDQALAIRQAIANEHPDEPEYQYRVSLAHASLADWHSLEGNMSEALDHANQQLVIIQSLVEINPDSLTYRMQLPVAMNRLSDVYRAFRNESDWAENSTKWLVKAEPLNREIVRKYPVFAVARRSLVNTLSNQGDIARHEDRPELAIEKYREALDLIEEGVKLTGGDDFKIRNSRVVVLTRMGSQLEKLGKYHEALKIYTRGLQACSELSSQHENYYVSQRKIAILKNRGVLFFSREMLEAAADDFRALLAIGNTSREIRTYLARIYLWGPNSELNKQSALSLTTALVAEHPSDHLLNVLHAAALLANGQLESAIEFCDKATALTRKSGVESFVRSTALAKLGQLERASQEFVKGERYLVSTRNVHLPYLNPRELQTIRIQAGQSNSASE